MHMHFCPENNLVQGVRYMQKNLFFKLYVIIAAFLLTLNYTKDLKFEMLISKLQIF